jgi:hypothetical protein
MKKQIVAHLAAVIMIILITHVACKQSRHYELSRFIAPSTCGSCHDEIYGQWLGSMHQLSHVDPLYREVALHDLKGLTDEDELKEAELCVKCHTPVGFVSGLPLKTSDHLKKIPAIAEKGIQCDYCHSATGAYKIYNASIEIDPGQGEEKPGVKRGPFKDSRADFHETSYSKFHTQAELCGACHDVRHVVFGTKLETPYEEWKKGPYSQKGIVCQDCHMYQRPGVPATGSTERPKNPGTAALGGPKREHIFTHYFTGANVLIPARFGNTVQKKMAEERLQNAATVTIGGRLDGASFRVTVTNTGAGHSIPTGLAHVRQVWLEVTAKDRDGTVLLHSGKLDGNGYLDSSAVVFKTVFGDGKGNPVMNIAKAREILTDKRIGPMKSSVETYDVPKRGYKSLTIEAKLWHRLAPQELVDKVLGKGKLRIPAVLMASDRKIVTSMEQAYVR